MFDTLARAALGLAFVVIVLGAFVRLSDAGLGCPDWPGCYGQLVGVPQGEAAVAAANAAYPQRAVDVSKAWKEMIHRYAAGLLGVLALVLAIVAWRNRDHEQQPVALPLALLLLVIVQALLGMWTVTLKLQPAIVMAHLLGGFTTLALLWWIAMPRIFRTPPALPAESGALQRLTVLGCVIVVCQIALGGWTSANYAALACPDFPTCQTQWWPAANFSHGFTLWHTGAASFEFGVLDSPARTAIHLAHRVGALVTALYVGALGLALLLRAGKVTRRIGALILGLLCAQLALGISNVLFGLPLAVAVAHNAVAALLLLALLSLIHVVSSAPRQEPLPASPYNS
ncbi:MAG: COX15/CtaA family protein [Gammaproteobacteria bacterium]